MSIAQDSSPSGSSRRFWLSSWHWILFVVEPAILLAVVLRVQTTQPENLRLLLDDSLGQKLLIQAAIFLAINVVLLVLGCWLLNFWLERRDTLRNVLTGMLHAGCFLVLFMPAVWVLTVGPSALQITRTLAL